ncbi:MAG: threonine synthase [Rhodospirillales bacterium]
MKYLSTRGQAPALEFDDVLVQGLAADGGLYVPESWPRMSPADIRALGGLTYSETAFRVIAPFVGGAINQDDLAAITEESYKNFSHPETAPLRELKDGEWLMELFHGPTLSFKDLALQFLGRVLDHVLKRRSDRITVLGATSGDTGSAAIEACRDKESIEIFIMHPKGRVSAVQRRQMTTVASNNVHNIAVEGTFDDCQAMMKEAFNDPAFRGRHNLSTVNSINWCRIMAQIAYYFRGAVAVGAPEKEVAFSVPTGNFGNVFSGYAARRMGLPISRLVVGSNRNDILTRFLENGKMEISQVHPTLSPSMDIQISSNFERLLYFMYGGDGAEVRSRMEAFKETGAFAVDGERLDETLSLFKGRSYDDGQTRAAIKAVFEETGQLIDPHSAIGVAAGRDALKDFAGPSIALATAHPAKFPKAIEDATGITPEPPPALAGLDKRQERCDDLPAEAGALRDFITGRLGERGALG